MKPYFLFSHASHIKLDEKQGEVSGLLTLAIRTLDVTHKESDMNNNVHL